MSIGLTYLHSHSDIERNELIPKHFVLVDKEYKDLFADGATHIYPYNYKGKTYLKVPILSFVKKGGIFKNLKE